MASYLLTCVSLFEESIWEEVLNEFLEAITAGLLSCSSSATTSFWHSLKEKCTSRTEESIDFSASEIRLLLHVRSTHAHRAFILFDGVESGSHGMGMACKSALKGDLVCLLAGCRVPVLLRPMKDNRYVVVGDAYVPYCMGGLPFDYDANHEEWDDFYLC
jgi:hypothetical protein